MKPYRKAASSTHSGVDSGRVGTKIASRASKAVLQPLTSFQIAKSGAGEIKTRLHTINHPEHLSIYITDTASILASSWLKSFCWYLTCQWCSRWAGWRFGGALLTERAFRTNQAVFSTPVTHLDAVCARGAGKLSAIRSSWRCSIQMVMFTLISTHMEDRSIFKKINFTAKVVSLYFYRCSSYFKAYHHVIKSPY